MAAGTWTTANPHKTNTKTGTDTEATSVVDSVSVPNTEPEVVPSGTDSAQSSKKRLSGAQKRKMTKKAKMAAGTWTTANPHKNKTGVLVKPEGKKRPRENTITPPQQRVAKRPRSSHEQTRSYSNVTKVFRIAVAHRHHPDTQLDQAHADLIINKLKLAVDEAPVGSQNQLLQFHKTSFSAGTLWVNCANEHTKKWTTEVVRTMEGLWEGVDLNVVDPNNMPKRPMVLARIPEKEAEESTVRTRLERYHPDTQLDQAHADLIINKLKLAVDEAPVGSQNQLLQFHKTSFSAGTLWVNCANEHTKKWTTEVVRTMEGLWEGVDLNVVDPSHMPKRPMVLARIPEKEAEESTVRTRLERQNKDLKTEDWLLKNRKVGEDMQILVYTIDEVSYKTLKAANFKAYYRLEKISFKTIRGIDGSNQNPASESPA
uniref:Uncharacterized protein LOC114347317 n=1 Tax=Diabrotica virgifera virgifera TaxID=50390 RepID=A0A6P7GVS0_DIAVI